MAKQHTIIELKENRLIERDRSQEYGHEAASLSIHSDSEINDVVIYIPIPGSDKGHEIVISKIHLKVYIQDLR